MEQEEELFAQGFNNGYLIAKYEPELAKKLNFPADDKNIYIEGLSGGKKQYEQEVREWAKSFSRSTPTRDDKERDKER